MKISFSRQNGNTRREDGSPPIVRAGKQDPIYLEQIKAMGAKFEYKIELLKMKVVAVTSAVAGEGKTTSCAQLAMNLVMAGRKKVLLIDADLRKSDLARGMNLPAVPGLSEFLHGTVAVKDIVRNSFLPGLYIIPAGTRVEEPANLLAGEKFRAFLGEVRGHFDIVLLDTPPILPVADTLSLRDQVDAFLFLYRAGFTPFPLMRQAAEEVGEEKVLGVILNGVAPQKQKYYSRYYGKYYHKPSGK
ncbi:MAG: protein tyrosine kinase [Deltaproteobacteria bacterium]|nr:MAG: protein tyrosine kinase [Deltaproteobacteria bacterium]